jgi:hypothetical protein
VGPAVREARCHGCFDVCGKRFNMPRGTLQPMHDTEEQPHSKVLSFQVRSASPTLAASECRQPAVAHETFVRADVPGVWAIARRHLL